MNQRMTPSTSDLYIVQMLALPLDSIQYYWQTLDMHDRLAPRICDVDDPHWDTVKDMIQRMGDSMFAIVNSDAEIQAEFMLENFTGNAAQIHFSILPGISFPSSVSMAVWATDEVLHHWYIQTLYGLTPVTNRPARLFNLKAGFKCIGKLPNGIRDRGKVVDGLIMVKEA